MQKPIFIVGMMRSGTTLLALILDSHPNISIGRESGFMRGVQYLYNIPDWGHGADWYTRYGMTKEQFNRHMSGFIDKIFSDYALSHGKSRWGEKTPFHRKHVSQIAEIFPDSQFIHIMRDVRAVCASRKGGAHKVGNISREWVEDNLKLEEFGKSVGAARYYLLRYEDIVGAPEETLRSLLRYLGEPWSDNLLRHNQVEEKKYSNEQIEGGNVNRSDRPIDSGSLDKWKTALRWWEILWINRIAAPAMKHFGY
ncbi:MAG: sulfotransferase family protein [Deltaproteobacteria bacterium]